MSEAANASGAGGQAREGGGLEFESREVVITDLLEEHHQESRGDGPAPAEAWPKSTASAAGGRWLHVSN